MALISLLSAEVRSEETIRQQVLKKLDTDLKALNLGGEGPGQHSRFVYDAPQVCVMFQDTHGVSSPRK